MSAAAPIYRERKTLWSPRWLDGATVGCVIAAVALLLWPVREAPHPITPQFPAAPRTQRSAIFDTTATQIVSRNLFSATRRTPTIRFIPAGAEVDMPPPVAANTSVSTGDESGPKLFGIVSQDGERRALVQLPGADSSTQLMRVGDRRAGVRVVSIAADRVVLATAAGSRTVRLVSRAPTDSSEKKP